MRVLLFVFGSGFPVACALAACSSFSSVEPPSSIDAGTESGSPGDAASGPDDGTEASVARCDAGPGTRACSDRYVFTSNDTLPPDFAADGGSQAATVIADAFCKTDAERQMPHPDLHGRSWRAWICTGTLDASGRVARTAARWITPGGVVAFVDNTALQNGGYNQPISGEHVVWTGCGPYGEHSANSCSGWTTRDPAVSGGYGDATITDRRWSSSGTEACLNPHPIYCFEE